MKTLYFHLGIAMALCPSFLYAQLYNDASANLPNVGAKGQSMDVRAADLDQDGDLDIILANEFQPNTLLFNDGTGKFTNVSASNLPQTVRDSEDVAVADFDGDGDLDLIFSSEDDINFGITPTHEYYLNDGTGKFTSAPFQFPDSEANAVIAVDINKDGAMDVIFGNKGQNTLFINRGDDTFVNETATRLPLINRTTQDLALADIDGDSDLDLFAGNENGNVLLLNNGTGIFTDVTATRLPAGVNMETRKVTFGDVDNDGDADVFLANVGFIPGKVRRNRLYLNDGTGTFSDVTETHLPFDNDHTLDGIFTDVDEDRDLDLVIGNFAGAPIRVYRNDGTGRFSNQTTEVLGQLYYRDALGIIAADLNGDQALDLYICDRHNPNIGNKDLLFLKIRNSTATKDLYAASNLFQLFPNPTEKRFTIALQSATINPQALHFQLLDANGKSVAALKPSATDQKQIQFQLEQRLSTGTYFVQITDKETAQLHYVKLVIT